MECERIWFAESKGRMAVREIREVMEKIQSESDHSHLFLNQKARSPVQQIMSGGGLET
jgi:hypothetical protein